MTPLEPNKYFHIYNRSNGNEKIFLNSAHYHFFLRKYREHVVPVVDTFCYCLMPNHFHLLIRVKDEAQINQIQTSQEQKTLKPSNLVVSKKFSNFFSSYSQAFNKQQNRTGSLFQKNFRRKAIDAEKYFYQLIHYIHWNPVRAKFVAQPSEWTFSSYNVLASSQPTFLEKKEVLGSFMDAENFKFVHSRPMFYDLPF